MDGLVEIVGAIARGFFEALFEFVFRLIARFCGYVYDETLRDFRMLVRYDVLAVPLTMLLLLIAGASIVFFSVKAIQWIFL